jgi:protein tyrosine phosphatase
LPENIKKDLKINQSVLHANRMESFGADRKLIASQCPEKGDSTTAFLSTLVDEKVDLIVDLTGNDPNIPKGSDSGFYGNNKNFENKGSPMDQGLSHEVISKKVKSNDKLLNSYNMTINQRRSAAGWSYRASHKLQRLEVNWADFGALPSSQLLDLAVNARDALNQQKKVLIHCRAGVGRTGTLASLIRSMDLIDQLGGSKVTKENIVDCVKTAVIDCRKDRGSEIMVQTPQQFQSLLNAALHYAAGNGKFETL